MGYQVVSGEKACWEAYGSYQPLVIELVTLLLNPLSSVRPVRETRSLVISPDVSNYKV